mgnify:CR=1 FL=1
MKQKINALISSVIGLLILAGAGFYVVPKFITKKQTKWTNGIDKLINFIKTNWIWVLVVVGILVIATITIAILLKRKEK